MTYKTSPDLIAVVSQHVQVTVITLECMNCFAEQKEYQESLLADVIIVNQTGNKMHLYGILLYIIIMHPGFQFHLLHGKIVLLKIVHLQDLFKNLFIYVFIYFLRHIQLSSIP